MCEIECTEESLLPNFELRSQMLSAQLGRMLVDQIAELGELVDGLRNAKATHQQVVDKWVYTYRSITQAFGVEDVCGCNANALFADFGILAGITRIENYEESQWCLPVEGTVSLMPDYEVRIQYQSLQQSVSTLFPTVGMEHNAMFALPGSEGEVSAAATAFDFYEPTAAEGMAANDNNWWAMTMPCTVLEPAPAAAEDAQSSSSNTYIGLDGREHVILSGVQLRKPVEVSDETIADLIRQIHELAKLVDVVNSNIRELGREARNVYELAQQQREIYQETQAQFTEKWSTVYQNVLDAFAATDKMHSNSKSFFDKVGLVVACSSQYSANEHVVPLHTFRRGFDAKWEAPLWIEEGDTRTDMQNAVLNSRIPLRKIINEIFPLDTVLKSDDLGAVATDDDDTTNKLHDHLQPFSSLTGNSQYVEVDVNRFKVEPIPSVMQQLDEMHEAHNRLQIAIEAAETEELKNSLSVEMVRGSDGRVTEYRVIGLPAAT